MKRSCSGAPSLCGLIGLHLDNCRIGRVAVRYDEETSSNVLGALPMQNVVLRFLLLFIPLCAAAIGLVWIGLHSHGFWSAYKLACCRSVRHFGPYAADCLPLQF